MSDCTLEWQYRNVATVAYPTTLWEYTFPNPLDGAWLTMTDDETAAPFVSDGEPNAIFLYLEKNGDPDINSKNVLGDTDFQLQCGGAAQQPGATVPNSACLDCPCDNGSCVGALQCVEGTCKLLSQTDADGSCVDGTEQCVCLSFAAGSKGCLSPSLDCTNNVCVRRGASQVPVNPGKTTVGQSTSTGPNATVGPNAGCAVTLAQLVAMVAFLVHL